jgi:phospholipid-binding lipoprotein MlaA
MPKRKIFRRILLSSLIFGIAGCATNKAPVNPQDPYENINRKIFAFNMAFDHAFIRPVAKVYDVVLPWQVKKGVSNFFDNIGDVTSAANELLQLDFPQTIADLARVAINTTIGIGGLFDVATQLGIERDAEDFGVTLAHWGSRNTPYIVLPILGPFTIRDAVGFPINYLILSPWGYIRSPAIAWSTAGLYFVQRRAQLLIGDKVVEQAFDPYVFIRDAYLQRRDFLIDEHNQRSVEKYVDEKGIKHRKTQTLKKGHIIH